MHKTSEQKFLFSPTDLVNFLDCNHIIFLDLQENIANKTKSSASSKLFTEKGYEHENRYLEKLKQKFNPVVEIPKNLSLEKRLEFTRLAMQRGADVIYQAALLDGNWSGNVDFLLKVTLPSNLGNYSYQALDTKLARAAEAKHIIQLCSYSELLNKIQGILPSQMHLVLGDNRQESFNPSEYIYYYQNAKKRFENYVETRAKLSYPEPCNACSLCGWKNYCSQIWIDDDHLSLVANIQKNQIQKLKNANINTLEQLATNPPTNIIAEINPEVFQRLQEQASLQLQKRNSGQDIYKILPRNPGKGFDRIPPKDPGDLFFDMEGDPLYPDGLEYLFGIYYFKNQEGIFKAFWAHDHHQEKVTFGQFMEFIDQHLQLYPNAYIYHYNHYETTALKRLACRYALAEEQLDNLLRKNKFIDLYKVVREGLLVSEPSYSIKNLETFYMPKRTATVTNAVDSIGEYNNWRIIQNQEILDEIANYNKTDCISTYKLRDWLISIAPTHGDKLYDLYTTNQDEVLERKAWEIEYQNMQQALNCSNLATLETRQRLLNLLEFHRREAKPQWWGIFERQDKTVDELIDDFECIADMTLLQVEQHNKQNQIYSYQFPTQEFKLSVGKSVQNIGEVKTSLAIHEINEKDRIIKFVHGLKKDPLPNKLSVGTPGPINTDIIRDAIYRIANSFLNQDNKYQAAFAIIERQLPNIVGHTSGDPIIKSEDLLSETIKTINNLNNSYMFIQGPPGAGKTFTSAHVICDLLRNGKKVAVAANSHKAIENLLKKIEQIAIDTEVNFIGVKKSSKNDKPYQGKFIKSVNDNKDITNQYNLVAGTVWLFSRQEHDQQFDYLFIDEAGQVSLANVLAMATAAKNIVLVGDQMQLGQPLQGVHPGDTGQSVLEFLLEGQATIAPERGIFLENTHRLHPAICSFISDAIYESRLKAHIDTKKRQLLSRQNILEGIYFISTAHTGCSQKSEQEGEIIKDLFAKLQKINFLDKDGTTRLIGINDILVVSPYNVQVNYLQSILPANAIVGTVDKFQGQEAPIVLVSMATSSAQEMPRNIEFLYSKNRLNVALSRAQCLAVVVANSALLEIPCEKVEQMKLVNTLCWLSDYTANVNIEKI
jgi:predicted RecB family nuclease